MHNKPVALVTGASRGIGRGIAREMAIRGFDLVVNFASNQEAAEQAADEVRAAGGEPLLCAADVASDTGRRHMVQAALDQWGRIDLLVNNVGVPVADRVDLLDATEESWDRIMGINLKGPYFLTQLVARVMIEQKKEGTDPKIVNISSVSAYASSPNRGEYCVAKAGMGMMTKLFADRLACHGIPVFELCPGVVRTDMTAPVKEKYDKLIAEGMTPIERWGEPHDVALAVAAIAEGYFPFSTGETINIDGGFHIRRL